MRQPVLLFILRVKWTERANEDFWKNNIEPDLKASRFLTEVVTPHATRPRSRA
jgi:hypothetical protein